MAKWNHMLRIAGSAGLLAVVTASVLPAQPDASAKLERNAPVERTLKGKETHAYTIELTPEQVLDLVVEQRGVDVLVRVLSPDGKELARVDSPNGDAGPENVTLVAPVAGAYRVTVAPLLPNSPEGRYEIRLRELRRATRREQEQARVEWELRLVEEDLNAATRDYDLQRLEQLMADDFTAFSPAGAAASETRTQRLERLEQLRKADPGLIGGRREIDDLSIRLHGDFAVVAGRSITTRVRNDREITVPLRFLHVWRRQEGNWLLVAYQFFPTDPLPRERTVIRVPAAIQKAYAGRYETPGGLPITIDDAGDHLLFQAGDIRIRLYPESETEYFASGPDMELTFVRDSQGRVTHAIQVSGGRAFRRPRLP